MPVQVYGFNPYATPDAIAAFLWMLAYLIAVIILLAGSWAIQWRAGS